MTIRRTSLRLRGLKRFTRKATRMTLATRARAPMCESAKLGIGRPTLARTAAKDASGGLGELELLSLTGGVEAAQERSHRLEPPPRGEAILKPPDEPRGEAVRDPIPVAGLGPLRVGEAHPPEQDLLNLRGPLGLVAPAARRAPVGEEHVF